jgi:ADP-dependent NAD(P)H-hydrate dehydratase / NAD(P)H-hydrate epimerase
VAEAPWLEPLFDAAGMRAVDAWAIEERGVPSLDLMERAGTALADAVLELAPAGPVRVVCGKGNNGGDGLVAARQLRRRGIETDVLLLGDPTELGGDPAANRDRLEGGLRPLAEGEAADALAGSGAIVDAIFGTGFSGAPREPAAGVIEAINAIGAPVIACDLPSGVDGSTGAIEGAAVEADVTVSFHAAKLGQLVAPGRWATGELRVVPIGIPPGAPSEPAAGTIGESVLDELPRREPAGSKFSSGEVVVAGGSRGLTGAVCMAAGAAIRAGAGYATAAVPASLEPIVEAKLTEVMTLALPEREGRLAADAAEAIGERGNRAGCVVLGPGLGREQEALALARSLAASLEPPLLIDADGLFAHNERLEEIAGRAGPTVLTPHAGELARLLGRDSAAVSATRLESAREAARRARAVVVLKGDDTIVTDGRRVAVNALSCPALATAGTGDVLSGTIAALVARGLDSFSGACAGVLAHARAGRIAAERHGPESVIATDVIAALPAGLARR